jgi:hypothetical protein
MSYKQISRDAANRSAESGEDSVGLIVRNSASNTKDKVKGYSKINLPSFDEGGPVEGEQGEPKLIMAHGGEEVLNPEDAEAYRAQQSPMKPLGTPPSKPSMGRIDQSHGVLQSDENPKPTPLISTEEKPRSQGSVLAKDWLKRIGASAPEPSISKVGETAGTPEGVPMRDAGIPRIKLDNAALNTRTVPTLIPSGELAPQDKHQETAGGPLINGAPTSETPSEQRDFRNMERKAQAAELDKQIQTKRAAGESTADLEYAKLRLEQTPWKDRSLLGKIGKVASTVGNIAGDSLAPNVMALTPNTDLNKAVRERSAYGRILTDTEAEEKAANTKALLTKEPKADQYDIKEVKDTRKGSPTEGQVIYAGVNKTDPSDVRYSPLQTAPKAGEEKDKPASAEQVTDYQQRIANSGLTGKALEVYGTAPAGATTAELDKRFDEATKLRGMNTADAKNKIDEQQRRDNALEHKSEHEETQEQTKEAKGRKMVIGINPATGREEMVPEGTAKDRKLTDVYDAPSDAVNKALSARHFIPLADNADPADLGILQQIDALDKEGKLGTISSRWNDFMAGKVGAGDPDFERLRVAMGLATTLLMNAHVGSRGGSYMMEHFEDLANAKKMDAQTLRAGVDQELKYIKNRAMQPASTSAPEAPKGATNEVYKSAKDHTVVGHMVNGHYVALGSK